MRIINLESGCSVPASECKRKRMCKQAVRCDGFNACGKLDWYPVYPDEESPYQFCGDCTEKFYICPNLILEGE